MTDRQVVGAISGTMEEMSELLGIDLAKHMVEGQQISEESRLELQGAWENTPTHTSLAELNEVPEHLRPIGLVRMILGGVFVSGDPEWDFSEHLLSTIREAKALLDKQETRVLDYAHTEEEG